MGQVLNLPCHMFAKFTSVARTQAPQRVTTKGIKFVMFTQRFLELLLIALSNGFVNSIAEFHLLAKFDDGKCSCQKRVAGHNERERKPQLDFVSDCRKCLAGHYELDFVSGKPHKLLRYYDVMKYTRFLQTPLPVRSPFVFQDMLPGGYFSSQGNAQGNQCNHIKVESEPIYSPQLSMLTTNRHSHSKPAFHLHRMGKQNASEKISSQTGYSVLETELFRVSNSSSALSLLSAQTKNLSSHLTGIPMLSPLITPDTNAHCGINQNSEDFVVSPDGFHSSGKNSIELDLQGPSVIFDNGIDIDFEVEAAHGLFDSIGVTFSKSEAAEEFHAIETGKRCLMFFPYHVEAVKAIGVHGCSKDLSSSKSYHKRHKVCDVHSKTARVIVNSIEQRFCQQYSSNGAIPVYSSAQDKAPKMLTANITYPKKELTILIENELLLIPGFICWPNLMMENAVVKNALQATMSVKESLNWILSPLIIMPPKCCRKCLAGHNELDFVSDKPHKLLRYYDVMKYTRFLQTPLPVRSPFVFQDMLPGGYFSSQGNAQGNQCNHIKVESEPIYSPQLSMLTTNRHSHSKPAFHLHRMGKQNASEKISSQTGYSVLETELFRVSNSSSALSLLSAQTKNLSSHLTGIPMLSPLITPDTNAPCGINQNSEDFVASPDGFHSSGKNSMELNWQGPSVICDAGIDIDFEVEAGGIFKDLIL
ncbi:unnamed protein product [Camellia sinensis]